MKDGMIGCSCLFSRRSLHTTLHFRGVQDTPLCVVGREGFVTFFVSRALTLIGSSMILLGIFVGSCLKGLSWVGEQRGMKCVYLCQLVELSLIE